MNGPYFTVGKGLRQGDPLSPLLFNLVVDVFTKMLTKACTQGLISGLLTNVVEGGIVSLQYANDTILWSFADSNSFSVQAVYKTISFRGGTTGLYAEYLEVVCSSANSHLLVAPFQ